MKRPTKLGSVSPGHREICEDPHLDLSPETPHPDPDKDDYRDDKCPGKTCLEEAEDLTRSPEVAESGGRRSGGRGSARSGRGTPSGPSAMRRGSPAKSSPQPAAQTGNVLLLFENVVLSRPNLVPPPLAVLALLAGVKAGCVHLSGSVAGDVS